jgi:hypothetical protein
VTIAYLVRDIMKNEGFNKAKTEFEIKGKKDKDQEYDYFKMEHLASNKVMERIAKDLKLSSGVHRIYQSKGMASRYESRPLFDDYSGRLLHQQVVNQNHKRSAGKSEIRLPQLAKNSKEKKDLNRIYEIHKFSKLEQRILRESKDLSNHGELKTDLEKFYIGLHDHKEKYLASR